MEFKNLTPMVFKFRKYDSLEGSLLDHGKLLSFSRYKSVITSKDYKEACQNVYKCGYCADIEYPEKLISIIKENKLYIYDAAPRSKTTKNISTEAIKYLQKCLNFTKIRDVNGNALVIDGVSGPLTLSSIKKLQGILNLSMYGICGPEILSGVKSIMERPLFSLKSTGYKTAIRYIQWRTYAAIDGIYGVIPTLQPPSASFGRVYATYGGIFIVLSILWGWKIDIVLPDKFDLIGGVIALIGVLVIMYYPRG